MDDKVFKALNLSSRRHLLDALFRSDGQSLEELCRLLPQMTRYGVMKHLGVLEAAGLVTTKRVGRHKLHYLNPVPIRLVYDRWISKYAEPTVRALAVLKTDFDGEGGPMSTPAHVYTVYINAEPKEVWHAITDGEMTQRYFYGTRVESTWEPGSDVVYTYPDGRVASDGTVLACDPPHRFEITFHPRWDPELEAEGPAREIWMLEDANGATKLTVETYDIALGSKTHREFVEGFPYILSGLKSVLETGESLPAPS